MRHNIFGFLKYLGTPYNLKKRPGALQVLLFFFTSALCIGVAWKCSIATNIDWCEYLIVLFVRVTESTAMIFFSVKNLRPEHPLIAIVEEIMEDGDVTKHTACWYLGLGLTLPKLFIIIYEWKSAEIYIQPIFSLVKDIIFLIHLAQVLLPLHAITTRLSQIRLRLHFYSNDPDSNPSKGILELIAIERRLEEAFNELTEEYSKDFIRILHISTGRLALSLCGSVVLLKHQSYGMYSYLIPIFTFETVFAVYRIWSVAHAAQLVRYQMEKFRSELYTKCLEDQSGNLAKNDMMSVFLERGLSHVSFTANGFLPLDHSLFCRMLSSAVTWVFIIIQFRIRDQ
ncbi:Gustatory receptor 188e [Halyomorpha halys]|nr:Gustatory receptor 188e [Halyomorpha halys]